MVHFHAQEAVPERFRSRLLYQHSLSVTLMRTPLEENIRIGEDIGEEIGDKEKSDGNSLPL
jgi:uncharacterized protein (UPF0261 family)